MRSIIALALVAPALTLAQVSATQTIGYQGRLVKSNNSPVNGTVAITFKLYDKESGGTPLWTESQLVTTNANGFYAAFLGSVIPFAGVPALFDGTDRWLELTMKPTDGTTPEETLAPRQKIAAVAHALMANHVAKGAVTESLGYPPVQQGTGVDQSDNVVKIGWSEPEYRLKATVDATNLGNFAMENADNTFTGTQTVNDLAVGRVIRFTSGRGPFCIFANECPSGWTRAGTAGIILHNTGPCPYSPGGAYNSGWTWCHPALCCGPN